MKYKINLLPLFLLSLLFIGVSCEDSRMHNMVDDKIYLLNPELNKVEVFHWGDYTYGLVCVKSGVGQQAAELELSVNEQLLNEYNNEQGTDYKLLPEQYYKFTSSLLTIGVEGYKDMFDIVFDTDGLVDLQGDGSVTYALPCQVNVLNSSIAMVDSSKMYSIIIPSVKEPYLAFSNPGIALTPCAIDPESAEETLFSSAVKTNYANKWELTYELEVDPQALEDYNNKQGTSYKLLPEAAYRFDESSWSVPVNTNAANFNFHIIKSALIDGSTYNFGEYVIPVRISSVSQHGIDPENSLQFITVSFQPKTLERTNWEVIDCSSEEPSDGGGMAAIIDGNLSTYWHSRWQSNIPELPHYLIIDMHKECDLMTLELIRRENNTNTRLVTFEVSLDNETYEEVGTMDFADRNDSGMEITIPAVKARYIKCIVKESNNPPHASIAEIYAKGVEK